MNLQELLHAVSEQNEDKIVQAYCWARGQLDGDKNGRVNWKEQTKILEECFVVALAEADPTLTEHETAEAAVAAAKAIVKVRRKARKTSGESVSTIYKLASGALAELWGVPRITKAELIARGYQDQINW